MLDWFDDKREQIQKLEEEKEYKGSIRYRELYKIRETRFRIWSRKRKIMTVLDIESYLRYEKLDLKFGGGKGI